MNKCRSRGALVTAVIVFSVIVYLAPLSRSPLQRTERNSWDDGTNNMVDVDGVMIDLLEMAVDLDVPSPGITRPNSSTNQQFIMEKDETTLPPAEVKLSGQQHLQLEANSDQESLNLWPRALQPENKGYSSSEDGKDLELANLSTENHNERASVHLDANNTKQPLLDAILNPFSISESLTLPVPFATLPVEDLLQRQWVSELQQILLKIPQGLAPVSIVSADYKFREVLINWLAAAKSRASPPLTHIVVFSLDQPLCELLKRRNIYCIFVAPEAFLTQKAIAHLTKHVVFSEVMVLRLTAMRLMNHWGYDAANYDTDAIILKSPESLYLRHPDSHMIGSYGHYPGDLGQVWGTTVCCGLFMTKSSPYTEIFWNATSTTLPTSLNDQARLNYAISALQPDWGNTESKTIMRDEWKAVTPSGFKVTVLPAKYICRQGCTKKYRSQYYVWHKGGQNSDGKMRYAQRGNLWFLRKDWEARTSNSSAIGDEWLKEITVPL